MIPHILPNTIAPLIVQATYLCGSAMLLEAILGFLGAGIPPEIPSWGNIMSEGRTYFQISPWIIFYPGIALAVTVLAVNIMGDGLRDTLDPRIARKMCARPFSTSAPSPSACPRAPTVASRRRGRPEEHASEIPSLMRTPKAVSCLKNKTMTYS